MLLSFEEEAKVWDNLLYQTIKKESVMLREAFIQLLIAQRFMDAFHKYHEDMTASLNEGEVVVFTNEDEDEFRKRANASVVIEKKVLLSNKTQEVIAEEALPPSTAKLLSNELKISSAKRKLAALKNTLTELNREEKVYEVENQAKYKADLAAHEANVKTLVNNATPTMVSYTDPETQAISQIETYPDLEIPTFEFEPLAIDFEATGDAFAKSTTTNNFLSTETKDLLLEEDLCFYQNFPELTEAVKERIREEESTLVASQQALQPQKVTVGGSKVTIDPRVTETIPYCFSGELIKKTAATKVATVTQFALELEVYTCLLYTSPSPRDLSTSRMPSSA